MQDRDRPFDAARPGRPGRRLRCLALSTCLATVLAACAHPDGLRVGMTRDELNARFGQPAGERHDAEGDVLIYSSAPFGERASAAHLDAQGRVVAVEPLLDLPHFATIRVGQWTRQDVLDHFGRAAEFSRVGGLEVWSYRYREAEVWYSLFSVSFDAQGIVRKTENGPDPMFDPSFIRGRD